MKLSSIKDHLHRVLHHIGKPLRLGAIDYNLRGYYSNVVKNDLNHEPEVACVMEGALATRQGAFVDVGVNIGQTLLKLLRIDPNRNYLGFEPQIACCFLIDQFIKDN